MILVISCAMMLQLKQKKHLLYLPYELTVKASVGSGNWAAVPWLGYFDPLITDTATRGFYVVYLINAQTEEIFLSLNQGTTETYREFGELRGREVLRRRAIDLSERAPEYSNLFDLKHINLGSAESLPLGYEAGHSFGRKYQAGNIESQNFFSDLENMFAAYEALVNRGGTLPTAAMNEEAGTNDIEETRRYVLSRRIERAPNIRKRVLEKRGTVCEACALDPVRHLNYTGPLKNTPLEIHHARPISGMAEGESRRYKIPDDFIILCPTCHRLIHRQVDPANLVQLKNLINFSYGPK